MKQTIVIKGKAGALTRSRGISNGEKLTGRDLEEGVEAECHETFSDYVPEEFKDVVTGGEMTFEMEEKKLMTVVTYKSERELTENELTNLCEYTSGQLSDGIGENFEQQPFKTEGAMEYYLSPWYHGQQLEATQTPK